MQHALLRVIGISGTCLQACHETEEEKILPGNAEKVTAVYLRVRTGSCRYKTIGAAKKVRIGKNLSEKDIKNLLRTIKRIDTVCVLTEKNKVSDHQELRDGQANVLYRRTVRELGVSPDSQGMERRRQMSSVREKDIEKKLVEAVREIGGLAPKFVSPGWDGVPDRLILLPGKRMAFVELKAPGKKLRPVQIRRKEQMESLGFRVYCIDGVEQIQGVLNEILLGDGMD